MIGNKDSSLEKIRDESDDEMSDLIRGEPITPEIESEFLIDGCCKIKNDAIHKAFDFKDREFLNDVMYQADIYPNQFLKLIKDTRLAELIRKSERDRILKKIDSYKMWVNVNWMQPPKYILKEIVEELKKELK